MSIDISSTPAFISREQTGDLSIVTFNISNSYEMPIQLLTSHISQFQSILQFAAKLIDMEKSIEDQYAKDVLFAEYLKTIEENHSSQLNALEKQSASDVTTRLSPLIQQINDIERSKSDLLEKTKREYEQQIKTLMREKESIESEKKEQHTISLKESKQFQKKISELETDLHVASRSETLIREQCKRESELIIKAHNDKNLELLKMKDEASLKAEEKVKEILKIKEAALKLKEEKLSQREEELQLKLQRQSSSVLRGHDGENYFADISKEKMNWTLSYTGDKPHSCDHSATIHSVPTFFEIKHYTHSVPQKEITKFLRDMKEHPEVLMGVFISLNTNIQGRSPSIPISFDWIHQSQCVMYIQSCADLDIDHVLTTIDQVIRLTGIFNKALLAKGSDSEEPVHLQRIEQAKLYFQNSITRTNSLIRKIQSDKKQQLQTIETNAIHSLFELKQQVSEISSGIQILLGDYTQDSTEDCDAPIETLPTKPKKTKKSNARS